MYARSNTFQADPDKIDELTTMCRDEVMPLVQGMDGCVGISMLAERATGRCIVATAWRGEEAMRASDQGVRDSRSRAAQLAGDAPEVAEWEITVMHRTHERHDGACTRVTWLSGDPAQVEDNVGTFRMAILPRLEQLPGFCSVSMMTNRQTGRSALAASYDSREAMEQSSDQVAEMRTQAMQEMNLRVTDMAEFDLILHHLRVPETV